MFRGAFRGESSKGSNRKRTFVGTLVGTHVGTLVDTFAGPLVGTLVDSLVGSNFAVRVLCASPIVAALLCLQFCLGALLLTVGACCLELDLFESKRLHGMQADKLNCNRSALKGRQQMGEIGFCKNLRFSAVSCEKFLRFSAQICDSQIH